MAAHVWEGHKIKWQPEVLDMEKSGLERKVKESLWSRKHGDNMMSQQTVKQSVCSLDSLLDLKCFQLFELFAVLLSTLGRVRHTVASFGKPRVSLRSLGMEL